MTCGVYKITNTVTGEFYIGAAVDVEKRWKTHKEAWSEDFEYECKRLFYSVKQYGADVFVFELLEKWHRPTLFGREAELIRTLKPALNGALDPSEFPDRLPRPPRKTGYKNRIKDFLKDIDKPALRMSRELGLSHMTVQGYCNDPYRIPRQNIIEKICKAYNVKPSDLVVPDDDIPQAS